MKLIFSEWFNYCDRRNGTNIGIIFITILDWCYDMRKLRKIKYVICERLQAKPLSKFLYMSIFLNNIRNVIVSAILNSFSALLPNYVKQYMEGKKLM